MKTTHKIALVYGLTIFGAAAFAWWRRRAEVQSEGEERTTALKAVAKDAIVHGMVAGTCISVAVWLQALNSASHELDFEEDEDGESPGLFQGMVSLANGVTSMGNMSKDAIRFLSKIDTERLYSPFKADGVTVSEVPHNEDYVEQE